MAYLNQNLDRLNASLARLQDLLEPIIDELQSPQDAGEREEVLALLEDRQQLADELDQALSREAELQSLADEASEALGAAIDEVRVVMSHTMSENTHR